jgi:hypothetical protein
MGIKPPLIRFQVWRTIHYTTYAVLQTALYSVLIPQPIHILYTTYGTKHSRNFPSPPQPFGIPGDLDPWGGGGISPPIPPPCPPLGLGYGVILFWTTPFTSLLNTFRHCFSVYTKKEHERVVSRTRRPERGVIIA